MSTPPPTNPPSADAGRGRPVWPVLLIAAGVVLLLSNLGWLDLGALWSLLTLWPVALIAVGVDVLTGGRYRLAVVVVAVAVALVWWSTGLRGLGVAGEQVAVAHALDGARAAEVSLRLGVGEVTVDAAAPAASVLSGTILAGRGETISQRATRVGDTVVVEITSEQSGPASVTRDDPRRWTLSLTRAVPVDLRVQAGVGRTNLDLRAAQLSALSYAAGVGETTVTLPETGGYRGEFDLGVGATTVRLPQSVEARVVVRTGLGRASVTGTFSRDGDVYTTPGYEAASPADRVELSVVGGVGAVTVQRVR